MNRSIAVLGLGSIGMRHARNLIALGVDVVGFDPDEMRRGVLLDAGGLVAASRDEALAGAEAAVVAGPSGRHLDDLGAAIDAGCHVFVEKPLSHVARNLADTLGRADAAGRIVFAGLNLRFHPVMCWLQPKITEECWGVPLWGRFQMSDWLPSWRPMQDYRTGYAADPRSGGVLFDMIHEFDIANALLGPATTISATAWRSGALDIPVEDCAEVVLEHRNGARSNLHLDYVTRPRKRRFEIAFSDGFTAEADLDARSLTVWAANGASIVEQRFEGTYAGDYVAEMQSFLTCIRDGAEPPCDGRRAAAVLKQVLDARSMVGLPWS